MKSTNERLEGVFYREDGFTFVYDADAGIYPEHELAGKTEVSKECFEDLIHDRIVPWRLLEDGFEKYDDERYIFLINYDDYLHITEYGIFICATRGGDEVDVFLNGIKTYTDLLNLIKLIG